MPLKLSTSYYQQFDADWTLPEPALTYGGWQHAEVEIEPRHTALVLMHAWDNGTPEEHPASYRSEDHLGRANHIMAEVFPPLLAAARGAGLTVLHVVSGGRYYKEQPGYRRAVELAGTPPPPLGQAPTDPVHQQLQRFRRDRVYPGAHNTSDCDASFASTDFHPAARPLDGEGIAHFDYQLHALCSQAGVNHLIYAGFAINWCLLLSASGMIDMSRRGYICSTLREAVTAVENKETVRGELWKELALCRVSIEFGFVFGVEDFIAALDTLRSDH